MVPQQHGSNPAARVWIVGLGSQYPNHVITPGDLEILAQKYYDTNSKGCRSTSHPDI